MSAAVELNAMRRPQDPDQEDEAVRKGQQERLIKVWDTPPGWRYWSDVNNTTVGVWYTVTSFAFMLFAGVWGS